MKILLLNGSPKGSRSNTYRLASAFVGGISDAAQTEVRECTVSKLDIKPCLGCFACWNKTPGKCCMNDDMTQTIEDMLWADTIIWSFPLYYFSVPAPLKNLMDRQLPMVLPFMSVDSESGSHPTRYDMTGKRHVVISTCGFYTAQGNYDGVNAIFDHLCGKGNYESIYCGQGELFRVKELSARTDEYLGFVRQAGTEFSDGSITAQTSQKLSQLLYPRNVFEAMADASWGVEKSGEKSDESLIFTRQMAALYNKASYAGKDIVLQMHYTDIEKTYQIILGKDGSTVLTDNFQTATTTIDTPYTVWKAIAAGEISGEEAMMQGKYRVTGDFSLMIRWDRYFGSETQTEAKQAPTAKTSMQNLMPWAALWMLGSIEPYGMLAVIALCAALPCVLFKTRKTIYDVFSALAVTACACLNLAGVPMEAITPASYLCFGLMWTVSCFLHVPLSAHYSVNSYGDAMAENPLFQKTNRIICAGWGILYILVPLMMLLMNEAAAGIFQAVGSAAMGIFTIWFQNWYPAWVARGK